MPSTQTFSLAASPQVDVSTQILGMHRIVPMAFEQQDMTPLWEQLVGRVTDNASDAAAMVDLATILQSLGRSADAEGILNGALELQRDFCIVHGDGKGLRILAFVTAGDFMANTPIDFLLNGTNCVLWLRYVDADTTSLDNLPEHDVAFMAVGETNDSGPVLERMAALLADWPTPIMNNNPRLIADFTRDSVHTLLADDPEILSPLTLKVARARLDRVVSGDAALGDVAGGLDYPVIIRPLGTHAGHGLERLSGVQDLRDYLGREAAEIFYVADFIDYRDSNGIFSKQRVVLIHGQPFASHKALSSHWMVHYMNADMGLDPAKRAIEAEWMANFDTDYAVRHADAFAALYRKIGLDYFGMDCAEMPDGRLLIFELDVAMIVHDMDDPEIYPYKKAAMRKLFDAFVAAARDAAAR